MALLMASSLMAPVGRSESVVYPDYIYFGGDSTGTIWKVQESDMSKVAESADYGGNINAIAEDNHYLYVSGENGDDNVWKIQKYNMAKATESIPYDDRVNALVIDDTYVYIGGGGGAGSFDVWKLFKSDLTKVADELIYGGAINALAIDDDYIYVGGAGDYKVKKIQKSDMTLAGESVAYGGVIQSISIDDDYIYVGGMTTNTVRKIQKSDMAQVDETANLGATVYSVSGKAGNDYVYVGGAYMRIKKIQKSDMVEVLQSGAYTAGTMVIEDIYGDHIYVGGGDEVWQMLKSDLTKVAESGDYGDDTGAISGIIETETESIPLSITIDNPSVNTSAGAITIEATLEHSGTNDLSDIPINCSIYRANVSSSIEDFETDDGGCTASGTILWAWGTPSVVGPGTTHSGTKCWGTVLDANYEIACDAYLDLPSITIIGNVTVSFWHWYAVENHYDNCYVKISDDAGVTWTTLYTYTGSNGDWEQVTIYLTDYEYSDVIVRFHLDSDASEVAAGWYIDDVMTNTTWDSTPVYSESTTADVLAESTGVATFTPAWDASNGIYNILMETFLTGAEALVNNNTNLLVNVSGSSNAPPNITCVYPANNSVDLDRIPQCYVCVNDTDLDALAVSFYYYDNDNSIWILDYNESGVSSGNTVYWNFTEAEDYEIFYQWKVIVNDSTVEVIENYSFTTNRDMSEDKNFSKVPGTPGGGGNNPPSTPETPGFETITILIAITIIFSIYRKRKK